MNKKKIIPFFLISLFIFVLSIFGIFSNSNTQYKETTGTIKDFVDEINTTSDTFDTYPIIDYMANGKWYKDVRYGSYSSSMEIGDKVKVYYDPSNPESIQAEGYKVVPYVTLTASSLILVGSVIMLIKR